MKFDIKAHLQNHAYYFKQNKEIDKNDLHFNFSYLDIQFFKSVQPPETTLFELLQELKKPAQYKVKNGYYINKQGEKKQKYTTRKINLKDAIKIEAIHTEGADGEYVMPHIHLILSKDARLGKDFSLLKTHIIEISKKFGLRPNFAEISQNNPNAYKSLGKAVKNFSWIIRKMPNADFKKYVSEKLSDKLDKLWEYTLLSGNLQYYIKTLKFIQKRLNRQRIDFEYKGHNLRNTYPLPLTQTDIQVIELINKKKFSQKDIKPFLNNAIMRDFVRYSYFKDKSKALIINSISKQTNLLENLRPNKKIIDNYLKLYEKTLDLDKQTQIKEQQKEKKVQSIKEILKQDLLKVAHSCKNEKELRQKMQELNYIDFGFKKKQGKVYAYQFKLPNEDKKIIVKCADSIDIKEIRAILKENFIKSKKNEAIRSDITNERSKINAYLLPMPSTPPRALKIEYKIEKITLQKEKQKEIMKKRREYANNYKRIRELIANAKENATTIELSASRELRIKKDIRKVGERELSIRKELTRDTSRELRVKRNIRELAREKLAVIGRTLGRIRKKITNAINAFNKFLNYQKEKEQRINELLSTNRTTEDYLYRAFEKELTYLIKKNNIDFTKQDINEFFRAFLMKKSIKEIEDAIEQQKEIKRLKKEKEQIEQIKKNIHFRIR